MITNFLIFILHSVIEILLSPLSLLPDATIPPDLLTAISNASGYLTVFNSFVPVTTLLAVVSAVLVVEGFIIGYKVIMWLIKKIPTIS